MKVAGELVAKEHRHVRGPDEVHGGAHAGLVEGLEDGLLAYSTGMKRPW